MQYSILQGDVMDRLREIDGESVQTVVTSPPYWGLRDYGCAGQIGLEKTLHEYVSKMVDVFREVRRVLRKDGTVWLNIGDSYSNDTKWGGLSGGKNYTSAAGGYKGQRERRGNYCDPKRGEASNGQPYRNGSAGLKPKDLCMIPARVALALQADGWWLRSDTIWAKQNTMPESTQDRPTRSHEYLFLLAKNGGKKIIWKHAVTRDWTTEKPKPDITWYDAALDRFQQFAPSDLEEIFVFEDENGTRHKRKRWKKYNAWRGFDYYYDADAIKEPASPNTHARLSRANNGYAPPGQDEHRGIAGPRSNKQSGHGQRHDGFNGRWKQNGRNSRMNISRDVSHEDRPVNRQPGVNPKAAMNAPGSKQNGSFSAAIGDVVLERNKRDVWFLPTSPYAEAHFATFPVKLVEPCVLAGSRPGDIVLDPFVGSGTTLMVAIQHGRIGLGIELNKDYVAMAHRRIENALPLLAVGGEV